MSKEWTSTEHQKDYWKMKMAEKKTQGQTKNTVARPSHKGQRKRKILAKG
jgi:hypothetical protein